MRKLTIFLALGFLLTGNLFAQDTKATSKSIVHEGSILTYHVKSSGKEYDFIVTIKKMNSLQGIMFDWKMTDPVNKSGTITISEDADENAYAWFNFFSGGNVKLDKETSVFISFMLNLDITATDEGNYLSEEIKLNGPDAEGEEFLVKAKDEDFTYKDNGVEKTMKTVLLQNKKGDKWARIYNESSDAFIVAMSIGFDIELKSIKL